MQLMEMVKSLTIQKDFKEMSRQNSQGPGRSRNSSQRKYLLIPEGMQKRVWD